MNLMCFVWTDQSPSCANISASAPARMPASALHWPGPRFESPCGPCSSACSEDGCVASPSVLGASIAARPSTLRIALGAGLLPLLHPIRVAEDATMLDVLSNGRLTLAVGLGYAPAEFDMFGVELKDRARL